MYLRSITARPALYSAFVAASLTVLMTLPIYAGQSLVLNESGGGRSFALPVLAATANWRTEFQIHDYVAPASNVEYAMGSNALGFDVQFNANGTIWIIPRRDTYFGGSPFSFAVPPGANMLFRLQRDYANRTYTCEAWNADGTGYQFQTRGPFTANESWSYGDGGVNGSSLKARIGFWRGASTLAALGSRPPVTADTGDIFEFKFDGNGNDSSGNGRNLDLSGYSFAATPGQVAAAIFTTADTPVWTAFRPLRAGHADQLDGSASYSMGDASAAVACFWQQLDGPSKAVFSDRASCTPTLTGLVFGAYKFRLAVKDADGNFAVRDAEIGAVAYDDNGVVIYPDERLYGLIGPQMARGMNPWKYADEQQTALTLERAKLWKPNGGTQFVRNTETSLNGTTFAGTVYWSDTTLAKTIYGIGTNFLDVFCGGAAGPANNAWIVPIRSTPAFGGNAGDLPRGLPFYVKSCASDTQISVETYLESERNLTVASPGVPWGTDGNGGQYPALRTGTVYIANGSNKLYGTGTAFKALWCGGAVGAAAAYSGVLLPDSPVMKSYGVASCQSDTEATLTANFTGTTISSPGGAWIPTKAEPERGTLSINANMNSVYYDTPLAMYREWYRSGDIIALRAARYLAENALRSVPYAQWANRSEMVVSGILAATVDSAGLDYNMWPALTARLLGTYAGYVAADWPTDQREGAYAVWGSALLAKYHPDSATRSTFRDYLVDHYNKQATKYKIPGHGYMSWYPAQQDNTRVWQVSAGSDEATIYSGPDIDSTYCGTASHTGGTASATNGSTALTGSGTSWSGSGDRFIFLIGTKSGTPWIEVNRITGTPTNTSITLAWPWQGDTGALTRFHIHDSGYPYKAFERINSNNTQRVPREYEALDGYTCQVLSATKIKLDHGYVGNTSGGEVYRRISAANQYESFFPAQTQPFMDGLRASAYAAAADALDGINQTVSDGYRDLVKDLIDSLYDNRDPVSNGQTYFAYFPPCKGDPNTPDLCNGSITSCGNKRDYSLEGVYGFSWHYLKTLNSTEKTRADQYYNWMYAKPGEASPFASDGCYSKYPEDAMGIARDKALGQAFGHGGGSTWPAARLGRIASPVWRDVSIGFLLSSVPNAVNARIRTTSPTGGVSVTDCGNTSPCRLILDKRLGSHWMVLEYRSSSGAVVAASEPQLIDVP